MKPWEQRQQIPNSQIRDSADSFKAAWDLLEKQPPGYGFALPQINVGAIAIELYLKSLSAEVIFTPVTELVDGWNIVTAKSQKSVHTLIELFDLIDPDIQRDLDLAFSNKKSADKRTFRDTIAFLEGAFSASRYPYEKGSDISKYKLADFGHVMQCLHDFVSAMDIRENIKW